MFKSPFGTFPFLDVSDSCRSCIFREQSCVQSTFKRPHWILNADFTQHQSIKIKFIHLPDRAKGKCANRKFLKSFCDYYCLYPITLFKISNPTDCVRYLNSYVAIYYLFLSQAIECENNFQVNSKKLCLN